MEQAIIVTDDVEEIRAVNKKRARRGNVIFGIIIMAFAIIGLLTAVYAVIVTSQDIINNTRQKAEWENYIMPAVMMDTMPFENPNTLTPGRVQTLSVMAAVLNNDLTSFAKDEIGFYIIPHEEVEKQARYLFGPGIIVEHDVLTEDMYSLYTYDMENKVYLFQSSPDVISSLMPKVTEIEKIDGDIYLTVISEAPHNVWENDSEILAEGNVKIYKYVIRKVDGANTIYAIVDISGGISNDESSTDETTEVIIGEVSDLEGTE